jgi:hypothetical protein
VLNLLPAATAGTWYGKYWPQKYFCVPGLHTYVATLDDVTSCTRYAAVMVVTTIAIPWSSMLLYSFRLPAPSGYGR